VCLDAYGLQWQKNFVSVLDDRLLVYKSKGDEKHSIEVKITAYLVVKEVESVQFSVAYNMDEDAKCTLIDCGSPGVRRQWIDKLTELKEAKDKEPRVEDSITEGYFKLHRTIQNVVRYCVLTDDQFSIYLRRDDEKPDVTISLDRYTLFDPKEDSSFTLRASYNTDDQAYHLTCLENDPQDLIKAITYIINSSTVQCSREGSVLEGYLQKTAAGNMSYAIKHLASSAYKATGQQGDIVNKWAMRYFVLYPDRLSYFTTRDNSEPAGFFVLDAKTHITDIIDDSFWLSRFDDEKKKEHKLRVRTPDAKVWHSEISYLIMCSGEDIRRIFGGTLSSRTNASKDVHAILPECIEYLKEKAASERDLFVQPGDKNAVSALEVSFEYDYEYDFEDPHVVASLLLSYLSKLSEPLIPFSFYGPFSQVNVMTGSDDEKFAYIRDSTTTLPARNLYTLTYIFFFLKGLIDNNQLTLKDATALFGSFLLRREENAIGANPQQLAESMRDQNAASQSVFQLYLQGFDQIFTDGALVPLTAARELRSKGVLEFHEGFSRSDIEKSGKDKSGKLTKAFGGTGKKVLQRGMSFKKLAIKQTKSEKLNAIRNKFRANGK